MEKNGKEELDKFLGDLEVHTPSMRFSRSVVDSLKEKTEVLKPRKNPLHWIPKLLIGGSVFALILLIFGLLNEDSEVLISFDQSIIQNTLFVLGGLATMLILDKVVRRLFGPSIGSSGN